MFGTAFVVTPDSQDTALMLSEKTSTSEVLQLTGATARQLQWWDEHRLVVPLRDGRKRSYSATDIADILVILELRRRHISLQQVRRVLRFLKKTLHARLADLISPESEAGHLNYHLLIDGRRLYLETDTQQIFELLREAQQAVFLISLTDTVEKLRLVVGNMAAEVSALKKESSSARIANLPRTSAETTERHPKEGRAKKSA